jgi:hypothetical protein
MNLIRDEGYFKLYLDGDVLTVTLANTDQMPTINYHAMVHLFDVLRADLHEHGLTQRGWFVLYDFTDVVQYEMATAMPFALFFGWARKNGRRKAAHIFPAAGELGEISRIKRIILSIVTQQARAENDHYTATDPSDALRWFQTIRDHEPA